MAEGIEKREDRLVVVKRQGDQWVVDADSVYIFESDICIPTAWEVVITRMRQLG